MRKVRSDVEHGQTVDDELQALRCRLDIVNRMIAILEYFSRGPRMLRAG